MVKMRALTKNSSCERKQTTVTYDLTMDCPLLSNFRVVLAHTNSFASNNYPNVIHTCILF